MGRKVKKYHDFLLEAQQREHVTQFELYRRQVRVRTPFDLTFRRHTVQQKSGYDWPREFAEKKQPSKNGSQIDTTNCIATGSA